MSVRAKFRVHSILFMEHAREIRLSPIWGDGKGNEQWSKATPNGELKMTITNPDAFNQFEVGKDYFVDFKQAE